MSEVLTSEAPIDLLVRIERASRQSGHKLPEKIEVQPLWRGIAFAVDRWRLLLPMEKITDVVECGPITSVPRTRSWLRGVANVRGTLYSVTDLAAFLGHPKTSAEAGAKLLVLNEKDLHSALLVAGVFGLKSFDEERDAQDASTFDPHVRRYVSGAFREEVQTWGVLDVSRLVGDQAFREVSVVSKSIDRMWQ